MKKIAFTLIGLGIVLVLMGVIKQVPPSYLVTTSSSNGVDFGSVAASVTEYVGGDAYNYIIGAAVVGPQVAAVKIIKWILIVGGILVACIGCLLYGMAESMENKITNNRPVSSSNYGEATVAQPLYVSGDKAD